MSFKTFLEKVSPDCQTGAGIVPNVGPFKDFKIVRTNHLDQKRQGKERDEDFTCNSFDEIIKRFFQKRPLGVSDGDYSLFWKNEYGVQCMIININNNPQIKSLTVLTIMQLNKRHMNDYRIKQKTIKIDLGRIPEPKK